jgi:hypothetical protein
MKLELKHLAPYLPYGLNGIHQDRIIDLNPNNLWVFTLNAKPILRPLSDLDLDLWNIINDVDGEYYLQLDNGNVFLTDTCDLNLFEISRTINVLNQLFKNHFDVFGLIKRGLAIDINTIDK